MITFKEFLELAEASTPERGRRRLAPRPVDREKMSDRSALKKAGFKRSPSGNKPTIKTGSSSDHHFTASFTNRNQSDYVASKMDKKLRYDGKVERTSKRVLRAKALRKQLGGDRTAKKVHDVSVFTSGDSPNKNDPKQLISRGKSFKKEIKAVPSATKQVGGKAGDKVVGRPAEVQSMPDSMPASQKVALRDKGAKKRGKIYNQELGGSKTNPKTGLNIGNLK